MHHHEGSAPQLATTRGKKPLQQCRPRTAKNGQMNKTMLKNTVCYNFLNGYWKKKMVCGTVLSFLQRTPVVLPRFPQHSIRTGKHSHASDSSPATYTDKVCEMSWLDGRWLWMSPQAVMGTRGYLRYFISPSRNQTLPTLRWHRVNVFALD